MTLLTTLDYASVFIFALTGALAASRAQLDIIGFLFFASLTAVGGGTVRDLLLDRNPVFWMEDPAIIATASAAAFIVFFTAPLMESRASWLEWLDAMALAIAVPAGLGAALETGHTGLTVVLMGVATGTFGGLMRDVIANEVPMLLRQGELYATAAFAGALAGLTAHMFGATPLITLLICATTTFILRAGSLVFHWRLPVYRSRPPRR